MFRINLETLPIKIHFLLFYGGICPLSVFGSSFAKQVGLSGSTIALIYFSLPILAIFVRIILGIIGDKLFAVKRILFVVLATCAATFLLLFVLPPKSIRSKADFRCGSNETLVRFFNNRSTNLDTNKTYTVECDFDDDFLKICTGWLDAISSNESSTFCKEVSVQFDQLKPKENSSRDVRIRKALSSTSEIVSPHCFTEKIATCFVKCEDDENSVKTEILLPTFWHLFVLYILFTSSYYTAGTFSDTICFQLLDHKVEAYGRQRLLGSVGWGSASLISGFLIDYFSEKNVFEKNYKPLFVYSFVLLATCTFWSCTMKVQKNKTNKYDFKKVRELFRRLDVVIFACWAFFNGVLQQIMWQYMFWFLEEISTKDETNWLKSLQGLYGLTNTLLGDMLAFFSAGWIIKKIGMENSMTLILALGAIRFFIYSVITTPTLCVPLSSLDGILFGFIYVLIASYADSIAEPGTNTTVQAVFNCIFDGLGTSVGGLFGGFVYSWVRGAALFRISGYVCLILFILHTVLRFGLKIFKNSKMCVKIS